MSDRKSSDETEIEVEIGDEVYKVSFIRETTFSYDSDYGADADGRRGVGTWFVDDDDAKEVFVNDKKLSEYDEAFQKEINSAIQSWMDENNADVPEASEPEREDFEDR